MYQVFSQATKYNPKGSIAIAVYQDARLLVSGDNIGNDPGTLNLIFRAKMQGNQQEHGYMVVFPEYEYANLKGGKYVRYSANIGYVFNRFGNFELGASFGYGWIDRNGTLSSFSAYGELAYKLTNNFKIALLSQYTERGDIGVWRYSGLFGFEIKI